MGSPDGNCYNLLHGDKQNRHIGAFVQHGFDYGWFLLWRQKSNANRCATNSNTNAHNGTTTNESMNTNIHYLIISLALLFAVFAIIRPANWPLVVSVLLLCIEMFSRVSKSILIVGLLAFALVGCASLQPGANPIIVRAEQAETTAKASFDLVLNLDNSNRSLFEVQVPAFHNFCEWLRDPQVVEGTNYLPRASAMLIQLDDLKLAYAGSTTTSNALLEGIITVETAATQASSWLTVTTNLVTK